jgi:transglutaminase-like putative cysteine protease
MTHPASLRTKLRDLAAAAAFASMALSGMIPAWVTLVFAIGMTLALFDIRPLNSNGAAAALLGVAAVLLYGPAVAGRLDLVVAASTFAALVSLCRVLATPDAKADGHVFLTSLLMISGGAALSGEMLFALSLFAFAVLSIVSTGLSVIQRASERGELLPVRPAVRQLLLGAGAALAGGALLFALLPRFSWNVASRSGVRSGALAGFSDRVSLAGTGRIKTNPRIVARIKIAPDPGVDNLQAYWLARSFDSYDGREWRAREDRRMPKFTVLLPSARPASIHQWIELLPSYGARTLIGLQWPVAFSNAAGPGMEGTHRVPLTEFRDQEVRAEDAGAAYSYQVDSVEQLVFSRPPEDSRASPRDLQLPARLDPRVAALAREVADGARDPLEAARRLEQHLKASYRYDLELAGEGADPLAAFLFARKAGHCEQFATALTVMLRTLGIPARLATGFFGGERIRGRYVLRAGDAHAWTQLVLPDRIVSMDATPEERRAAQKSALVDWIVGAYETLNERWRSSVVDYSLQDQEEIARRVNGVSLARVPTWTTAIGLAGVAALVAWLLSRTRRKLRLPAPTSMLNSAERILTRAGVFLHTGECIEQVARRLTDACHPLAKPLCQLTRRYLEARFGGRRLRQGESAYLIRRLSVAAIAQRRRARASKAGIAS